MLLRLCLTTLILKIRGGYLDETKWKSLGAIAAIFICRPFVGSGVLTGDFYKLPILIAAIIASAFALSFNQKQSLNQKIEWFASGAGHPDIIIMVIILY